MVCWPSCLFLLETEEVGLFVSAWEERLGKWGHHVKLSPIWSSSPWAMSSPAIRMLDSIPENLFVITPWTEVLAAVVIEKSLSKGFLGNEHWGEFRTDGMRKFTWARRRTPLGILINNRRRTLATADRSRIHRRGRSAWSAVTPLQTHLHTEGTWKRQHWQGIPARPFPGPHTSSHSLPSLILCSAASTKDAFHYSWSFGEETEPGGIVYYVSPSWAGQAFLTSAMRGPIARVGK